MATKSDFKAAQERIFARPRVESKSDQELLRKTEDDGVYPSPLNVKAIRLDRLAPDPGRPPRTYSEQSLADLGQSLLAHGQLAPILVQYESDSDIFVLVDGERRWRAAQKVGLQTLQAVILARLAPAARYEQQVAAALQQEVWSADERVQAIEDYKARAGLATWAEVAARLGVSQATVQALMQEEAQEATEDGAGETSEALSQAAAAMSLLEDALSRLRPGRSQRAEALQLLDELAGRVAAQQARLQRPKRRATPESKIHAAEGAEKPARRMPTWGQR